MLAVRDIRKRYDTHRVLEGVSFGVGEGQKVAIVGENGVGKSTLLKIIAGLESFERGERILVRRALVGYLGQETNPATSEESLGEYLKREAGIAAAEQEMARLASRLAEPKAAAKYEVAQVDFERLGGYLFRERARAILEGLCLDTIDWARPLMTLSGGERRKIALAGTLLSGVDLLLLDEPTNNLDLPALLWLEKYLAQSAATVLLVSHDRAFLDATVSRIIEIDVVTKQAHIYTGGWSDYALMKVRDLRRKRDAYRAQEEEKQRIFASSDEKRRWAEQGALQKMPDNDRQSQGYHRDRSERKLGTQAETLKRRALRMNKIAQPVERAPLSFPLPGVKGEAAFTIADGVMGYPGGYQSTPLTLTITPGERIGIFGENGAGKTTLLKTLSGALTPCAGLWTRGLGVVIGNVYQDHEDLPRHETPSQIFKRALGAQAEAEVALLLEQFRFTDDLATTKLRSLSPGERVRVALALLVATGKNTLMLDEPTNHLDLETIEALEEALEDYPGTVLVVTHDRRFIERLRLDRLFVLEQGALLPIASYGAYVARLQPKIMRLLKRLEERVGRKP